MNEVTLTRQQAKDVVELLEGWSLVLNSGLSQRLFDILKEGTSEIGVYSPLRYDIHMGPPYVGDAADALVTAISEQLAEEQS